MGTAETARLARWPAEKARIKMGRDLAWRSLLCHYGGNGAAIAEMRFLMSKRVLILAAAIVMVTLSGPAISQPATSAAASSEPLSTRDLRAQKREARHLQAKQKKLFKRQHAKAKQHLRRRQGAPRHCG